MEVYWLPFVDPRKTCVFVIISGKRLLTDSGYPSRLWEKRHLVRFFAPAFVNPVGTYSSLVLPSSRKLWLYAKLHWFRHHGLLLL
jgi:hypothetical protein